MTKQYKSAMRVYGAAGGQLTSWVHWELELFDITKFAEYLSEVRLGHILGQFLYHNLPLCVSDLNHFGGSESQFMELTFALRGGLRSRLGERERL